MSSTMSKHALPSQASSSTITLPPFSRPRPVKKPLVKPVSPLPLVIPTTTVNPDLDSSPLTPLSSPIEHRQPQNFPKLSPEPTVVISASQTSKSVTVHTPRKRAPKSGIRETWNLNKLETYVWVLVDCFGRVFEREDIEELESQNEDRIWWPGKVSSALHSNPLYVTLINPPEIDVNPIAISDPCESNILPWTHSTGRIRFEEPIFTNLALLGGTHASPRKKQKVDFREDLKRRWHIAVKEIITDVPTSPRKSPVFTSKKVLPEARHRAHSVRTDEEDDSDLPEVGTKEFRNYTPTSSPAKIIKLVSSQGLSKRKRSLEDESSDDDVGFVRAKWSPRPPDFLVSIPGELVLAIERASDSIYWPARVLDYQAADKQNKPDKYLVEFLDGKRQHIPRRWFYIAEEEGFVKCKLGKWDSTIKEVLNDDEANPTLNDERSRCPSPIPADPPPSAEAFRDLDIREQFVYVKPVLFAILNENFPPAMQRHANFLAGGSKRQGVVEEAGLRGHMDPRDVDALQHYVTDWCLRDEQRAQIIVDVEDISIPSNVESHDIDHGPSSISSSSSRSVSPAVTEDVLSDAELPPTSSFAVSEGTRSTIQQDISTSNLPRQYGCEAFEALSRNEKVDYCLNVLLPETILQILLWRYGCRISPDLLTHCEEAILHEKGLELLKASDWVNDVMRLRMTAVGQLGKSRKGQKKDGEVLYSNTGRPRRGVGAPRSYLE